jgi:hypothetical protein
MRKKYLIILSLLILLLLVAIRGPSDSSLRFINQQNEIAKPQKADRRLTRISTTKQDPNGLGQLSSRAISLVDSVVSVMAIFRHQAF